MAWREYKGNHGQILDAYYQVACFDSSNYGTAEEALRDGALHEATDLCFNFNEVEMFMAGMALAESCYGGSAMGVYRPAFICKYCGADSFIDPTDQTPPPDYCHESDHGNG
jgi:hypothetical protein